MTLAELIAAVKIRGMFPDANGALTDSDIAILANQATIEDIQPYVLKAQSDYWVQESDITLVPGTSAYRVPKRAIVGKLRDAKIVGTDGTERELDQVSLPSRSTSPSSTGEPVYFSLRGDQVVLVPGPGSAGTLRLRYYLRRPSLVASTAVGVISSINTGTNTVTCTTVPSTWTNAMSYDLIRSGGLFDHLAMDRAASAVVTGASGTLVFSSLPADLAVGDHVALAGQSTLVCLSEELATVLVGLALARCLSSLGDERAQAEMEMSVRRLNGVIQLLSPRTDAELIKIVPAHSPLRGGRV